MAEISPQVASLALPLMGQAAVESVSPTLMLLLCVAAGVATVFLLPNRREPAVRGIAGVALAAVALVGFLALPSLLAGHEGGAASFYFWAFSAVALTAAVRVVTHPRPVYSALYFVLTVFATAGLFVLVDAEFMAAALVIIYAGAILVTYVFVIMLASQAGGETAGHDRTGTPRDTTAPAGYDRDSREPVVAAALGFTLMGVLLHVVLDQATPIPVGAQPVAGTAQEIGVFLRDGQLAQLEVGAVVLLVSMVGAIVITRRRVVHVPLPGEAPVEMKPEVVESPFTPVEDNPHSVPVYGTDNPRRKAYPQT